MIARGFVPEQVVPPVHKPDITPELEIASEPPKICRTLLVSEMPVPAVTTPVVEALTLPFESVERGPFGLLETMSAVEEAVPFVRRLPKSVEVAIVEEVELPMFTWSKLEVEEAKRPSRAQSGVDVAEVLTA